MDELKIKRNNVNITIYDNEKWGVIAPSNIIKQFFLELSGIEKKYYDITFNGQNAFDNEEYFKKRLYIDFSENSVSTLDYHIIKESLKYRYDLDFDEKTFNKYVSSFVINRECKIDSSYHFTSKGKAMTNFAVASSLKKDILIINNPTIYQDEKKVIEEIVKEMTDKPFDVPELKGKVKERIIIMGLDNSLYFENKLDYILLINQNYDMFLVDPKNNKLVMIDYYEDFSYKAVYIGNGKMFLLDNLDKAEYKILSNHKIKAKHISPYIISKYLKEDNNG